MALVLKDRVKETSTTTGTGTFTLAGASTGFQSFSVIGDGNTTYYAIVSPSTGEWEVGLGTYTASGTTLARTTVLESSNSGSAVNFSAGNKDVFVTYPAEHAVVSSNNFGTSGQVLTSNGANAAASWQAAGGGGLTGFTAAESTTSPNNTVYVDSLTSSASSTNADVAFVAKGTGATLAQIPDSTSTGGDKRGSQATDWQKSRTSSAQVASAQYSTISGGLSNTASGLSSSVGGGRLNTASSGYSFVGGGFTNIAKTNTYATVAGGGNNTSSGQYSFTGGGYNNSATGAYSVVNGGSSNVASGSSSAIIGGSSHLANSEYSSVIGGWGGTTRSIVNNIVAGSAAIDFTPGVSQSGLLILGRQTTNATATVLASNANAATTTNQLILPNNAAYYFKGSIIAGVTGGGNSSMWSFEGGIKRGANAASTVVVGTPVLNLISQDSGASAWVVALAADTTNGGLKVTVTGQASTTIRWVCKIETTEMTY